MLSSREVASIETPPNHPELAPAALLVCSCCRQGRLSSTANDGARRLQYRVAKKESVEGTGILRVS